MFLKRVLSVGRKKTEGRESRCGKELGAIFHLDLGRLERQMGTFSSMSSIWVPLKVGGYLPFVA